MPIETPLPLSYAVPPGFGESGLPRSPGLHQSDIIHDLAATLKIDQKARGAFIGVPKENWFEMGFCWERALEVAFGDRLGQRLPEIECDGIAGSPDGLGIDPETGDPCVEEYKCTTKTMIADPITTNWKWTMQVSGYCYMLGVNVACFRVLWLMGDRRPPAPKVQAYRVEFSNDELERNWLMMKNHAKAKGWL